MQLASVMWLTKDSLVFGFKWEAKKEASISVLREFHYRSLLSYFQVLLACMPIMDYRYRGALCPYLLILMTAYCFLNLYDFLNCPVPEEHYIGCMQYLDKSVIIDRPHRGFK
jgi:hypothetical protein